MVNSVVHMPLKPSKIKGLTKERVGDTLAVQCEQFCPQERVFLSALGLIYKENG